MTRVDNGDMNADKAVRNGRDRIEGWEWGRVSRAGGKAAGGRER